MTLSAVGKIGRCRRVRSCNVSLLCRSLHLLFGHSGELKNAEDVHAEVVCCF